jgi:hypothetical protein
MDRLDDRVRPAAGITSNVPTYMNTGYMHMYVYMYLYQACCK